MFGVNLFKHYLIESKVYFFIMFIIGIIIGGCIDKSTNIYTDTSYVDYSRGSNVKIVDEKYFKTSYVNFLTIKLSINIPIDSRMTHHDSLAIKHYIDSVVSRRNIKPNTTNISVVVFKETNYTNKVASKDEMLLFCENVPCIYNMSVTSTGVKYPPDN